MDVRVGLWRKLSTEELMLLNCGVGEDSFKSPWDYKEIQPVHSEGDQPWDFFGRNDAKAETPVLWPPHAKCWLIAKDSDAGRDWGQEEKGILEDETVGWHHQLNGHGFGWTPGVGDRQGDLSYCGPWSHEESDITERLNWTENFMRAKSSFLKIYLFICFWLHWVFTAAFRLNLVVASRGYCLIVVNGLLTAMTSVVAEHGLRSDFSNCLEVCNFIFFGTAFVFFFFFLRRKMRVFHPLHFLEKIKMDRY